MDTIINIDLIVSNFSIKTDKYFNQNYSNIQRKNRIQEKLDTGLFNFSDVDVSVNATDNEIANNVEESPQSNESHEKLTFQTKPAALVGGGLRNATIGAALGGGINYLRNNPRSAYTPGKVKKGALIGAGVGVGLTGAATASLIHNGTLEII